MSKVHVVNSLSVGSQRSLQCLTAVIFVAVLWDNAAVAADVAWRKNVDEAMSESVRENKPMLVMISAGWCGHCHKMLRQTFPNPAVSARVNGRFVPVLIDADRDSELVEKLKIQGMPTLLIVGPDRKILGRISGFQSAAQLDAKLALIIKQAEKNRPIAKKSPSTPRSNARSRKTANPVKRTSPTPAQKSAE